MTAAEPHMALYIFYSRDNADGFKLNSELIRLLWQWLLGLVCLVALLAFPCLPASWLVKYYYIQIFKFNLPNGKFMFARGMWGLQL